MFEVGKIAAQTPLQIPDRLKLGLNLWFSWKLFSKARANNINIDAVA